MPLRYLEQRFEVIRDTGDLLNAPVVTYDLLSKTIVPEATLYECGDQVHVHHLELPR